MKYFAIANLVRATFTVLSLSFGTAAAAAPLLQQPYDMETPQAYPVLDVATG